MAKDTLGVFGDALAIGIISDNAGEIDGVAVHHHFAHAGGDIVTFDFHGVPPFGVSNSSACASTLRITFGNASPGNSASFTQRAPLGAGVARGTCAVNTVSSSGKCVNTWRTTPGSLRHRAFVRNGGAKRSADFKLRSCAHALPGTSVMAPSSPFSGRVRSSTRPSARSATKAAPRRNLPSRLGALRGNVS